MQSGIWTHEVEISPNKLGLAHFCQQKAHSMEIVTLFSIWDYNQIRGCSSCLNKNHWSCIFMTKLSLDSFLNQIFKSDFAGYIFQTNLFGFQQERCQNHWLSTQDMRHSSFHACGVAPFSIRHFLLERMFSSLFKVAIFRGARLFREAIIKKKSQNCGPFPYPL